MSIHQDMPSPRRPSPRRRASGRRRASARRRSPPRCSPAGRRRTSSRMIRRKSPRRYRGTSKHFIISLHTGWVDQPWTSLQMETSDGVWYTDAIASIGDLTKEGKKANITQSELVDAFADWERWSVEEKIRQLIVFWTGRTDLTLARPAHILPEGIHFILPGPDDIPAPDDRKEVHQVQVGQISGELKLFASHGFDQKDVFDRSREYLDDLQLLADREKKDFIFTDLDGIETQYSPRTTVRTPPRTSQPTSPGAPDRPKPHSLARQGDDLSDRLDAVGMEQNSS